MNRDMKRCCNLFKNEVKGDEFMRVFPKIKQFYKENNKKTLTIYIFLRLVVIISLIWQIFDRFGVT